MNFHLRPYNQYILNIVTNIYLGLDLDVKMWTQIKNPEKYKGQTMIIGSVTDGYNYFEAKYKRTRAFLEEMKGSGINLIITTKSNLVLRDIDL